MNWFVAGSATGVAQPPTLSGDQILLPGARPYDALAGNALALSEHDGRPVWSAPLPGLVSQVVADGSRAYWAGPVSVASADWVLSMVSSADGQVLGQRSLNDVYLWEGWTVAGGALLMPEVPRGQLSAFGGTDLLPRWSAPATQAQPLRNYGSVGVTADAGVAYVNAGNRFLAFRAADGSLLFDAQVPNGNALNLPTIVSYGAQAPVLADADTALLASAPGMPISAGSPNYLSAVSRANGRVLWEAQGQFVGYPVAAGGVVYAANQMTRAIEARRLADGVLLWSWTMEEPDGSWRDRMVLTDTHLFVATDRQTLALDLGTRQAVWRYARGGWLGMSGRGVLVLFSPGDSSASRPASLTTFNLR